MNILFSVVKKLRRMSHSFNWVTQTTRETRYDVFQYLGKQEGSSHFQLSSKRRCNWSRQAKKSNKV